MRASLLPHPLLTLLVASVWVLISNELSVATVIVGAVWGIAVARLTARYWPGRPRVARALIAAGHAESIEDAFNRHLSRGRPAYVPREGLGPRDAIGAIRAAGGLASLAHYSEAVDHLEWIRELVDMGLTGLEVHYRAFDPDMVRNMRRIATDLGERIVNFDVNGDAGATFTAPQVERVMLTAKPGSIVIGHMNRPASGTASGVDNALVKLGAAGFRFVQLSKHLT